ncbi:fibronectin type III domain-containing protein [Hanstruepera marina]|uniref:fibronectin type III domain-containing protein n=1 Tax=Hanstruepera marina TaxID=2873265 RepID=UPI001CA7804D|nr:fibronectin type III domain-containing protein [Hanstruepera marina]
MKKITFLFFTILGFSFSALAQYSFPADAGVYTVPDNTTTVTVNVNDVANGAGATAGLYNSFTVTADWSIATGDAWSSEARLAVTTSAGTTMAMAPTSGGANSSTATTLTFSGSLAGIYDPSVNGLLDLGLSRTYNSPANWTNIVVTINPAPACPDPSGMTASNVTSSSADLSWTAGNTETAWNLEWNAGADFAPGTGAAGSTATASPTATYLAMGLMPSTEYFIYYQADCGGDLSEWVGPFTATTLCATETPDYVEDFTTYLNPCWSEAADGDLTTGPATFGSSLWAAEEFAHSSASGFGAVNVNIYNNDDIEWLLSPMFDLSAGGYELLVDVALTDYNATTTNDTFDVDDEVRLVYSLDGTNWTTLQLWNQANTPSASGDTVIVDISALTGSNVQFAFYAAENTGTTAIDIDFHLDNFIVRTPPSCPEPIALAATTITVNSAELSWTETGTATMYNVELVTAGTAPTGTATDTGVSNPFSRSGLMASTDYEFYVQADCGSETSIWSGPFAFSTLCNPFGAFTENFDSASTPELPNCWSKIENAATAAASVATSTAASSSPSNSVRFFNSSDIAAELILVSPELSGDITLNRVKFSARDNDNNDIIVGTITDPTDATTFTAFETITSTSTFMEYSVNFDTYAGTDTYIAFKMVPSGSFDNTYIDDIIWEAIPSCLEPSDLTATVLTTTSAELGWTAGASETSWNVEVVTAGATPTGTATDTGVTNPFTKTELTADTAYDFYVQADCGGGDTSVWIGPFSFFTGYCIPVGTSADTYIDNFSTTNGGVNISNLASGYTVGSYADNTAMIVSQASEGTFDFSIEIVGGTVGCAVWVDWNNDFSFDVSEVSYSTTSYGDGPFTGSVTVPTGTADGDYRMRVMLDWNDLNPGDDAPCSYGSATTPRGETEDYTVNVNATLSTTDLDTGLTFTYYPNPVTNSLVLKAQKDIESLSIYNMLGQEVLRTVPNSTGTEVNMSALQTGTYFVKVTIDNVTETVRILKN